MTRRPIKPGWPALRWALLIVLALGAAVTAALGDPTAAWATGALAVLAAVGVLVPPLLEDISRGRGERRLRKQQISEMVADWPLALADADPYEQLRVSRSAKADQNEFEGVRAPYVARVTEPDLATAMGQSAFVLLRGPSKAGKSRTAFEVARRVFPDALVIVPRRPGPDHSTLAKILGVLVLDRSARGRQVVLWLDDVQDFIAAGSIDERLFTALKAHEPQIAVIATIRDTVYDRLLSGGGETGERLEMSEAARRQGLDLISSSIEVVLSSSLDPQELEDAEQRYPGEDFSVGLGAQLVDAPLLIKRFEAGRSASPAGAALVQAAVDWSRAGVPRPVARPELYELARVPDYRPDGSATPAFTPGRLDDGLKWACETQDSGLSLLREADDAGDTFVSFDYLEDYAEGAVEQERGERPIPPATWTRLIELLDREDVYAVGLGAKLRSEHRVARDAWIRAEATFDDPERRVVASLGVASALRDLGANEEAKARLEQLARVAHEQRSPAEAMVVSSLGLARVALGDQDAARDLERAVELSESVGGDEFRSALLINLAQGYLEQYKPDAALEPLERALAFAEEDEDDFARLLCLSLRGTALARTGRADDALVQAESALELAEEFGSMSTVISNILAARGKARATLGDSDGALSDLDRSYDLRAESFGPRHVSLAEPLVARADLKRTGGDLEGALDDLREAVAIAADAVGEHHMTTAMIRTRLAAALTDNDDDREAYEQLVRARDDLVRLVGPHDRLVAIALYQLGAAEETLDLFDDAIATYTACLAAEERVHGADHATLAYTLLRLGAVRLRQSDARGARQALERALSIREAALGPEHRDLIPILDSLANALVADGESSAAEEVLARLIKLAAADPRDAHTLGSAYQRRGGLRADRGDLQAARVDLELALEILVVEDGEYARHVADVLRRLGVVLRDLGDLPAAKSRLEWALAAAGAEDRDDPVVEETFASLEPVLRDAGPAADPGAPATIAAARDYVHDIRRRALDGEDLSAEVRRWTGAEAYDRREEELGSELVRVLERYLIVQVSNACWSRVRRDVDGPEAVSRELDEHFRSRVADLLLTVEVETVES